MSAAIFDLSQETAYAARSGHNNKDIVAAFGEYIWVKEHAKNLGLSVATAAIALIVCEAGLRLSSGISLADFSNFRRTLVVHETLNPLINYDPVVGWVLKDNIDFRPPPPLPPLTTMQYGIRRNGPSDDHVRKGGILIAGASFTAGSEVRDEDAWPAQLEQIVGVPVVNGGVGNYSADQIILHAEQLLPIVEPRILIVDFVPDNILGAGYSFNAWPKPYFTVDHDQLVIHNSPVPAVRPTIRKLDFLRDIFGHSLIVHRFMATFSRERWFGTMDVGVERANNDATDVTCHLMARLKAETDARRVRLFVSIQYGGNGFADLSRPSAEVLGVEYCMQALGVQFVDEFSYLKGVQQDDPQSFKAHYIVEPNGILGHKSRIGNHAIATLVANELGGSPTMPRAAATAPIPMDNPTPSSTN